MSTENSTNLVDIKATFRLPALVDGTDFTNDDLADEMDGLRLNFQRVKIPSGGALQFEMPGSDPENPDYARTIEGVILFNHAANAYWPEGSEDDENATPLCMSVDGKLGVGEPGGDCVTCALNSFGSGKNGKEKMCKNTRVLYLLRNNEYMPIMVMLPPTSIKPFNDFYNTAFMSRRRAAFGSVVSIGLKRMNNGTVDYSVATFKMLFDFTGEQLAQSKSYSEGFKSQVKLINHQRAAEAAVRADDDYDVYDVDGAAGNNDGTSSPVAYIDGDRDALPA